MSNQLLEATERAALRRPATSPSPGATTDAGPASHPMIALQRQVGNSLINRMLAQREGAKPEEEDESKKVQAKHDPAIQREEEDKEEVQAKHDPSLHAVQRASGCNDCPEVGMEGGPISDGLSSRIQASRGSGSPLDDGARTKMEDGFGTSFDRVRVHTDGESDALNHKLGAKAFTTGNDIYFRQDTSPTDHGLLAHELTHVVQQREMPSGSTMHVGPAGDAHEANADAMSASVNSSGAAQSTSAAQRRLDEQ